jgi:hypothetical protein
MVIVPWGWRVLGGAAAGVVGGATAVGSVSKAAEAYGVVVRTGMAGIVDGPAAAEMLV